MAMPAVVCAYKFRRPIRCMLDRDEDMLITGTRHPALLRYKVSLLVEQFLKGVMCDSLQLFILWVQVGFTKDGKISALTLKIYLNGGNSGDLSPAVSRILIYTQKL